MFQSKSVQSISRRGSSYESDLELWYSLFPVQWDRNDSLCFSESKNKYIWLVGTFSFQVSEKCDFRSGTVPFDSSWSPGSKLIGTLLASKHNIRLCDICH
jgi:hypothetical protein